MAPAWWQPAVVSAAWLCMVAVLSQQQLGARHVALCVWVADLYTGCIHYVFDHFEPSDLDAYFAPAAAVLGPHLSSFHQHHADPSFIWRVSFATSSSEILLSMLPQFALGLLYTLASRALAGPQAGPLDAAVVLMPAVLVWKTIGLLYGEFSHRQAHLPLRLRPRWVAALQRLRLMLPRDVHNRHHASPRSASPENNFCQIGVANPAVNFVLRYATRSRSAWAVAALALTAGDFALVSGAIAYSGA